MAELEHEPAPPCIVYGCDKPSHPCRFCHFRGTCEDHQDEKGRCVVCQRAQGLAGSGEVS